ncbi:MAG TPA: hypothetical protein VFL80_03880 [Thermoanaerobaculia bacterium]|nr:hypothetical protein [Thermoanaerobaculia bacterium]
MVAVFLCVAAAAMAAPPTSGERPLTPSLQGAAAWDQIRPHADSDGRDVLVVWSDFRSRPEGPPDLYGTRLGSDGNPIEPLNRKLADGLTAEAVVWGNGEYVVAGRDAASGIWILRVAADGTLLSAPRVVVGSSAGPVHLAWSGIGYALQWADREENGQYRLLLLDVDTRVDRSIALRAKPATVAYAFSALGSGYVFFFEDRIRIEGCPADGCAALRRITIAQDGATDQGVLFDNIPSTLSRTWAASSGGEYLVLASQYDFSGARVVEYTFLTERLDTAFSGSVYFAALPAGSEQRGDLLKVGWDGTEYVITFHAATTPVGPEHLAAVRVSHEGRVVDLSPFQISVGAHSAAVTTAAGKAGLYWADRSGGGYDIHGRTARTYSDVLRVAPRVLISRSAAVQNTVRLAANGPAVLAVWREFDAHPMIAASLVGSGTQIIIAPRADDQSTPVAAPLGNGFIVVWREDQPSVFRILARRVGSDGSLLDAAPLVIATETRTSSTLSRDTIDVASDGTTALVVWSGSENQIRGARVFSAGTVLDSPSLNLSRGTSFAVRQSPRVIWTGSTFVVLWAEDPNPPGAPAPPTRTVIRATRVSSSGAVDAASRIIGTGGFSARRFAVAQNGDRITVAWVAPTDPNLISRCLYIQQMDAALNLIGSSDNAVFCGNELTAPSEIELVRDGSGYLLIGRQSDNIVAYSLTSTGAVGEQFVIAGSSVAELQPAAVNSGNAVIVAYSRVSSDADHGGVARVFTRILGVPSPGRSRAVKR